ncbi:MAG: DUF445 domain-containing protein [Ramlibacter sp.]|nr:DUF445 domain-containing protein [Ramlibacter sp.]
MKPSESSPDALDMQLRAAEQARGLCNMKRIALGALLCAVALLALSEYFGRVGIWGWVAAFAEAATVGALADWFAVVALFRHPMGIPIPHTAIIPRNQQRIANNLAQFVRDKFLDKAVLLPRIQSLNPAHRIGEYLSAPERVRHLATQLQQWAAQSVAALDSPALERDLLAIVKRQLHDWNAAPTAVQLVNMLTQGGHHERVLQTALIKVSDWVGSPQIRLLIADKMIEMARREYPKMTWFVDKLDYTEDIADRLADRLAQALIDEVQVVLRDPDHPVRQHYVDEVVRLMERLEHDPDMQQRVQQLKTELLRHPALQGYASQLWQRLRDWLRQDLSSSESVIAAQFERYAAQLGQKLRDDPVWQEAANQQLEIAVEHLTEQLRQIAPEHIRATVQGWDTRYMVQEIERSVGKDLQYIRLNGTLIGGLAGLVLYALFNGGLMTAILAALS